MTRYAGRRAVIAGEATGIGLAIAKRLVEGGAEVVLTARTPRERAQASAELGSAARVVAPAAAMAGFQPVDGDGARDDGARDGGGARDGDVGVVDFVFADAVATARPLLAHVRDGGAVVLTAPAPSHASVQALAAELASRGIRVNAVAPGCIEAPAGGAASLPTLPRLPPLGRVGSAEEVARAALFLATEATFTTGARLPVDGGLSHP
ncbi:SDR family oxidoreductase [Streptomyces sp. NPDC006678]|uniref:SDR family NAD(P)-dependent oxidoreductase n=1 Tax=Streptomyces sp. NPDC006678 TaxID=3157185 RepID=UPI00340E7391